MKERTFAILEYDKIIQRLENSAASALGKKKCRELLPSTDPEEIRTRQQETADALTRIYRKGNLSFSGVPDIRDSIKRLEISSPLSAIELLRISSVLTATLRVKSYGKGITARESEEEYSDTLSERFELLEPMSQNNQEIMRCILSEEEIADDASPGLRSVRRQMKITNDKIHEQLAKIMTSQSNRSMLQDQPVTTRDGRYCIPVKSEYKNQFPGMVHDQSQTGSTLFIEPMAVVKLNNDLRELAIKEQDEIAKVLADLSSMFFERTEELKFNIETLTELDFIFARAELAKDMKANAPEFNEEGVIDIRKGRHPLIDPRKVVPIDIRLGGEFDLLVITGPNTGGKTVSLKTVGLFTLMGQAGLHIPALDGSKLAVFDNVFADIGDEQSIEQSLSTFSSHMKNTVSILKEADEKSLVLFDELGAGTDPTEGAALAMAVLTFLHNRGVHCMATTHYAELKVFALSTPGVLNACCEFDVETLSPTYRLLIGIPGKSNAFAISSKLGLSKEVIDIAESFIGTKDKSFEDLMAELEKSRVESERDRAEAAAILEQAKEKESKLNERLERQEAARDKILRAANEEARDIIQNAKDFADETIRKINKLGSSSSGKELEQQRQLLREKLGEKSESLALKKKEGSGKKTGELKVGSHVHVLTLDLDGKVSTLPNAKGDLYVQMGSLRTLVNISDIEMTEAAPDEDEKQDAGSGKIRMSKKMTVSTECNVIGMRVDEAINVVDKYLDDAYLSHLPRVTIIHGRGTGALKSAIHDRLKKTKYVSAFRLGGFGEGDGGVTIVDFKQ